METNSERIQELKEELEKLENGDNEEEYNTMLDDLYEPYKIGNISFDASRVLKELDPIAYNCGLSDFNDERITEIEEELEELEEEDVSEEAQED